MPHTAYLRLPYASAKFVPEVGKWRAYFYTPASPADHNPAGYEFINGACVRYYGRNDFSTKEAAFGEARAWDTRYNVTVHPLKSAPVAGSVS